jgi:hypothetical protein
VEGRAREGTPVMRLQKKIKWRSLFICD